MAKVTRKCLSHGFHHYEGGNPKGGKGGVGHTSKSELASNLISHIWTAALTIWNNNINNNKCFTETSFYIFKRAY